MAEKPVTIKTEVNPTEAELLKAGDEEDDELENLGIGDFICLDEENDQSDEDALEENGENNENPDGDEGEAEEQEEEGEEAEEATEEPEAKDTSKSDAPEAQQSKEAPPKKDDPINKVSIKKEVDEIEPPELETIEILDDPPEGETLVLEPDFQGDFESLDMEQGETAENDASAPAKPNVEEPQKDEELEPYQNHPYMYLLDNFKVSKEQLTPLSVPNVKHVLEVPCIEVDSHDLLLKMVRVLRTQTMIGVDLFLNSKTFEGTIGFISISTLNEDYLIDAVALKADLLILTEIFINPKILKIVHKSWKILRVMQVNARLFMVNVVDLEVLGKACDEALISKIIRDYKYTRQTRHYPTNVDARPVSENSKLCLRSICHYMIYAYMDFHNKLVGKDVDKYKQLLSDCNDLCKKLYGDPKEIDLKRLHEQLEKRQQCQKHVLDELYAWREKLARAKNCSPEKVQQHLQLLDIACLLPVQDVLVESLLNDTGNPKDIEYVIAMIRKARTQFGVIGNRKLNKKMVRSVRASKTPLLPNPQKPAWKPKSFEASGRPWKHNPRSANAPGPSKNPGYNEHQRIKETYDNLNKSVALLEKLSQSTGMQQLQQSSMIMQMMPKSNQWGSPMDMIQPQNQPSFRRPQSEHRRERSEPERRSTGDTIANRVASAMNRKLGRASGPDQRKRAKFSPNTKASRDQDDRGQNQGGFQSGSSFSSNSFGRGRSFGEGSRFVGGDPSTFERAPPAPNISGGGSGFRGGPGNASIPKVVLEQALAMLQRNKGGGFTQGGGAPNGGDFRSPPQNRQQGYSFGAGPPKNSYGDKFRR